MTGARATPPVRIGIAGAGWVAGARHARAIRRDRRATLAAVFDHRPGRAERLVHRGERAGVAGDLEGLLAGPLDAVVVCTPPRAHAGIIEAALRAGKHVLCEKPLTICSPEGRRLESLAERNSVALCPAHNFLYMRSVRLAARLVDSGEVGEVLFADGSQASSWRRRLPAWFSALPGGLFFDESPHLLYLMRHFLGELTVRWAVRYARRPAGEQVEQIEAHFAGERGPARLTVWNGAPASEWALTLHCSRAVLLIDLFRDILVRMPPERGHRARDILAASAARTVQHWVGTLSTGARTLAGRQMYGADTLMSRFLDHIVDGSPPPATARDGWQVVRLMEDVLETARLSGKAAAGRNGAARWR